ncbi:hypothetical protein EU546_00430 [Candidatus Thorarchaeota archaeon]|nr:MAG: hypothetical protein EU546_00430 [Candidatus Thorarchaeota archaeon]
MIQSVYVVNEGGETLASIPIGDFQIDEVLFGGFLSAIQMYSQRVSGKDLKELSLENYRIILSKADRVFLVTIHDQDDKNASQMNTKLSELIEGTLGDVITDETVELIREAATEASNAFERATDWASKML